MKKFKTLIVIVTYNRSDVTNIMFESLIQARSEIAFDVFVVDNLSQSAELSNMKNKFNQLFSTEKGNIFFENNQNAGYSAANNLGILHGLKNKDIYSHICLLNNDTIVTDFWLDRLISRDDGQCLVGPVTNSVGNEQRIIVDYQIQPESSQVFACVNDFSNRWYDSHKNQVEPSRMLAFFCVLGSTKIFEEVGILDENFGIGMFEDDDFCQRTLQQGKKLIIARDTFLHHWGSASFSKLKIEQYYKTFDKNQKYWEQKNQRAWMSYYTTVVDSLVHELKWNTLHPSALSDLSLKNYEGMVKHLIQREFNNSNIISRGSMSDCLLMWQQNNIHASKWQKVISILLAYALQIFPSYIKYDKISFVQTIKRLKSVIQDLD